MDDKIKKYLSRIGRKGGKRALVTLTDQQRSERARRAGSAPKRPRKAPDAI